MINASLRVAAAELANVLRLNRETLVAERVLEGDSPDRAEIEVSALLDWFEEAAISFDVVDCRIELQAELEIGRAKSEPESGSSK